jgi:hypothetical protein
MMTIEALQGRQVTVFNAAAQYWEQVRLALSQCSAGRVSVRDFNPSFALPTMSEPLREYFSVSDLRFTSVDSDDGPRLILLDLMQNPATRTTKTFASLLIVARAIRFIRESGERIMILTPSSANKATALRDAVLRAYRTGLATPRELQIVTLVPDTGRAKLWSSALATDPQLAARNPMCVLDSREAAAVKPMARTAADECASKLRSQFGINLWYTLDLANYQCADAIRAFAEHDVLPPEPGRIRAHAHAVSSAFGLLGHHFGTTLLPPQTILPRYFLVQHLATSDMVVSLYGSNIPEYRYDCSTGLHYQDADPRFPWTTFDPSENLEPTFYTHAPATSPAMNEIIKRQGGGGIVVSLHECLSQYARIRWMLDTAGVNLPADPRKLREWSLVMAMTGVLNAVDRGLLLADEIIVHGSGCYSADDFTPLADRHLRRVAGVEDLRSAIMSAARGT